MAPMDLDLDEEAEALEGLRRHSVRCQRTLSGLALTVPSIGPVDRLGQLCAAAAFGLALLTPLWIWLAWMPALEVLLPSLLLAALVLSAGAERTTLQLTLSPQALSTPGWSVPLEDIEAVRFEGVWRPQLVLVPKLGTIRHVDVPGPLVARKLSLLIERHAARRRAALQGEGHDTQRAALPPEALAALVRPPR